MKAAYLIEWIESERGWGQKFSHYTLAADKASADEIIKKEMDSRGDGNHVPDIYWQPSEPRLVEITTQGEKALKKNKAFNMGKSDKKEYVK